MDIKKLYLGIIFRVVLVMLTSLIFAFTALQKHIEYSVIIGLAIAFQAYSLIKFLDNTNRKIAFFFEAIENNDSTLYYPVSEKKSSLNALHENLNRVNKLIHTIKIEQEAQEKYFQKILEEASIGIFTMNDKGHIFFTNRSVKSMLGRNSLTHMRQLEQVNLKLFVLISKLKPFDPQLIQLTNEREVLKLSARATTLTVNHKELLLVIIQNINSEIEHNEVDSWNKLFSVLTHEIMNTIAPITSLAEGLVDKIDLKNIDKQSKDYKPMEGISKGLTIIENSSKNLVEFVNSYKKLTKIPNPDKHFISVATLFDKIKILCSQEKGFNEATFKVNVSSDLMLFGDEKQIIQVLINIVKNALESMVNTTNGTISLNGQKEESGKIILQIADNGPGIPETLLEKIFIPFFSTKNEGTGIGLSLSKHIMRLHGGTIQVYSGSHRETIFKLDFPSYNKS